LIADRSGLGLGPLLIVDLSHENGWADGPAMPPTILGPFFALGLPDTVSGLFLSVVRSDAPWSLVMRWLLGWSSLILLSTSVFADRICRSCEPVGFGEILHRDSTWDAAFIGHAALHLDRIYDVSVGRAPGKALRAISLADFKAEGPYWGAKALKDRPRREAFSPEDWEQWQARVLDKVEFFMRSGVTYDYLHIFQKGKRTDGGHFLFDCVGFTEHLWESLGYNPTPDRYEKGWGWPLTVREQRDSPHLEHAGH